MTAQQRFRITVVVVAACSLLPLAYSVFDHTTHRQAQPTTGPGRSAYAGNRQPGAAMMLQVMPAPYQLPAGISREVVLPGAGGLLMAGGLTSSGASTDAVTALDPVTGTTRPAGRLAAGDARRRGRGPGRAHVRAGWRDRDQRAHHPGVFAGDASGGGGAANPASFGL